MFWNKQIDKPFGTFFIEEEEDYRIDVYDTKERWLSKLEFETDEERIGIVNFFDRVTSLKALLAYIGIEYVAIIEGIEDAVNFAYEEGYLDECEEPEALYDNEWVNFIGNSVIFIEENALEMLHYTFIDKED